MAEIRSTMAMVLERAARMEAAAAGGTGRAEELEKEGMRLAAGFLRGDSDDLASPLAAFGDHDGTAVRRGAVRALLRNIFLPRETEQQEVAEKAIAGLMAVGQGRHDLLGVFGEIKKIIEQYLQHRGQLRSQLEAAFEQQMQQMEQNMAQQTGMNTKVEPSMHPKFQEEWQRLQTDLNTQYGNALTRHKQFVEQQLSA